MADLQFNEEQQLQHSEQVAEKSFLTRLVFGTGLVSTDRQAEYVLLGIAAFLFILAFLIPSFIGGTQKQASQSVINAAMIPSTHPQK